MSINYKTISPNRDLISPQFDFCGSPCQKQ